MITNANAGINQNARFLVLTLCYYFTDIIGWIPDT